MTKQEMMNEIIYQCEINNVKNMGDIFFSLAFRTEKELIKICQELHIKIR